MHLNFWFSVLVQSIYIPFGSLDSSSKMRLVRKVKSNTYDSRRPISLHFKSATGSSNRSSTIASRQHYWLHFKVVKFMLGQHQNEFVIWLGSLKA